MGEHVTGMAGNTAGTLAGADVIVAGAGPAGSTAAALLAQRGLRVLLVDREEFPRPKACGDVVPLGCFLELRRLGLARFHFDPFTISHVLLEGSDQAQRRFHLRQQQGLSTAVVPRSLFDQALYEFALACGARFMRLNIKGPLLDGDRTIGVTGTSGERTLHLYSRLVIAADGATSAIARGLATAHGFREQAKRDDQWAIALRGYVTTDIALERTIELAFLDHIQLGYAWFFPVAARRANVGIGMRLDFYKRQPHSLDTLLAQYLALPKLAQRVGGNRIEDLQSWPLPLFSFEKQRVFNGALLAGDAGGFVHPITAAGIYPAIVTGKCAAEAALYALERGNVSQTCLSRYDTLWQEALTPDFRPAVTAAKLSTLFPHLVSAALRLSAATPEGTETALPFASGKF